MAIMPPKMVVARLGTACFSSLSALCSEADTEPEALTLSLLELEYQHLRADQRVDLFGLHCFVTCRLELDHF